MSRESRSNCHEVDNIVGGPEECMTEAQENRAQLMGFARVIEIRFLVTPTNRPLLATASIGSVLYK
jgi:hypothetical protein